MITPGAVEIRTVNGWQLSSVIPPMGALTGAPASARAHVRAVLPAWGIGETLTDDCATVASELVTNALRASTVNGRPRYVDGRMAVIRVVLLSDGRRVLIEVYDQAGGRPVMQHAAADAETGRGLEMVHALTGGRWGWREVRGTPGKCVWAKLRDP